MRKFIYVWCLVIAGVVAQAQNFPVYNTYYMNPYLYNPAEVASEYAWLFVNHRQQWMNVEGARYSRLLISIPCWIRPVRALE